MSAANTQTAQHVPLVGETLRQPTPGVRRRFEVVVKEVATWEDHVQDFRVVVPAIEGKPGVNGGESVPGAAAQLGYVTTCQTRQKETVLFSGVFEGRPKLSALAQLMEGGE